MLLELGLGLLLLLVDDDCDVEVLGRDLAAVRSSSDWSAVNNLREVTLPLPLVLLALLEMEAGSMELYEVAGWSRAMLSISAKQKQRRKARQQVHMYVILNNQKSQINNISPKAFACVSDVTTGNWSRLETL